MSEFYDDGKQVTLGDPSTDPPLTVRIEPGRHWRDHEARRAILTTVGWGRRPWLQVTGMERDDGSVLLTHAEVASWPVQHPIEYGAAFRHAVLADEQVRAPLAGDDLAGPDANLFR